MGREEKGIINRRLRSAYMSTVISISLVLLLVGMASLLLVNARTVSDYFKENMQISVMMKQDVTEKKAKDFLLDLGTERYIKSAEFISVEQGEKEMAAMLGEDFLDVFESSPIPVSIDVTLKADYVSADSLEMVQREISASPLVDEVVYQPSLVEALNANLSRISLVLGVFIALLLFSYHEARGGYQGFHQGAVPGAVRFPGRVRRHDSGPRADSHALFYKKRSVAAFRDFQSGAPAGGHRHCPGGRRAYLHAEHLFCGQQAGLPEQG